MKTYIAGGLFKEGDVAQRLKEEELLREHFKDMDIYNPINAPCNDKAKLPTAEDIFDMDTDQVLTSDVIIAEIQENTDIGVATELGIAYAINLIHDLIEKGISTEFITKAFPRKQILAHFSDIRMSTANKYSNQYIPVSLNQYLVGCIEKYGKIVNSFDEVINSLKESNNE